MPNLITGVSADLGAAAGHFSVSPVPPLARPLTLAGWVRLSGNADHSVLFAWTDGSDVQQVGLYASNNSYSDRPMFNLDGVPGGDDDIAGTTGISLATWTHVALVWEADGTIRHYLNGTANGTGSNAASLPTPSNFLLGSLGFSTRAFYGLLSQPAMWSAALSTEQIADLAGGASPGDYAADRVFWFADLSGAGPHLSSEGTYTATESGTLGDAPSDPPVYEASAGGVLVPSRRVVLATPMDVCLNPVM